MQSRANPEQSGLCQSSPGAVCGPWAVPEGSSWCLWEGLELFSCSGERFLWKTQVWTADSKLLKYKLHVLITQLQLCFFKHLRLQLRLQHSLGQGIPAAPAPGAALETVNSQCQSLVFPGNRLLTLLPRQGNGPAGIFGHKTVTGNSCRILEQLNETSTPSLASYFQENNSRRTTLSMSSTSRPPLPRLSEALSGAMGFMKGEGRSEGAQDGLVTSDSSCWRICPHTASAQQEVWILFYISFFFLPSPPCSLELSAPLSRQGRPCWMHMYLLYHFQHKV